jgi:anti-sigma factor RsiW
MGADECRRVAERLTSWADEALAPAEQADLNRHLAACGACRQAAALEHGGRTLLRTQAARLRSRPLPQGLQSRCEALIRPRPTQPMWRRPLVSAAFAAGLVLFIITLVLALGTSRSATLLAAQLTADHLKCFHLLGEPDNGTDDATALEAILRSRYDWHAPVPPSSDDGQVQLLGVRRCLYAEGAVPHVMYRANGQDMSLYRLNGVSRDRADVVTLGYRSRMWSGGDATYVLVSRDGAPGVAAAAAYVMQRAR